MTDRPHIWVYPGRCFGAPALAGHRLPTATVARYYSTLGEQETRMAYVIKRDDIIVCCWFEARYGKRRFKNGWSAWLEGRHSGRASGTASRCRRCSTPALIRASAIRVIQRGE